MLTLGINHGAFHDSSAAIAADGRLLFAIAEERLSRRKHDGSFPRLAIRACLDHVGVRAAELDHVAFGWQQPTAMLATDVKNYLTGAHPTTIPDAFKSIVKGLVAAREFGGDRLFQRYFGPSKKPARRLDHHFAHAVSAYAVSGLDEATVVIMDGRGAWESTTVWHGAQGRLRLLDTVRFPNSLGLFYSQFTGYLGFERFQDEWKVMGLAPYGGPGIDLGSFISITESGYRVDARRLLTSDGGDQFAGLTKQLGPPRDPSDTLSDRHRAIAWAVQDSCERAEIAVIEAAVRRTGCRNLCLAGGVALNSKANGLFLARKLVDRIFVQPAASDDGVAIGAALAPCMEASLRSPEMFDAYLGPASTASEIEHALRIWKLAYEVLDNPAATGAELLAGGQLIGWYQGREEFGPRALGNRSILADPRDVNNRDRVNNAVKFREEWRPFAPSVLEEFGDEYFEGFCRTPFMTLTFMVRPERRARIAATVHVDGSARVQSVNREQSALYYDLIRYFRDRTGVPVLLNTSFNLKGEAIVSTPFDAIRTFFTSGLDALIIDRFLLRKTPRTAA